MNVRSKQVFPTQERRRELIRLLDELAEAGDANAIGWLLLLDNLKRNQEVFGNVRH
ncbi:hypothetical protein R3F64_15685 [Halomonas sp. 5021]|jgi:hypothetical protein|uniref:hypothetical protein n=1 Tax=Halomonas sp. 5021 TaxID=3082156 RepID=UPI002FCBB9C0